MIVVVSRQAVENFSLSPFASVVILLEVLPILAPISMDGCTEALVEKEQADYLVRVPVKLHHLRYATSYHMSYSADGQPTVQNSITEVESVLLLLSAFNPRMQPAI